MVKKGRKLIVFTRYPEPGTTKTRLIPVLGVKGAAVLQKCLTEHMILTVRELMEHDSLDSEIRFEGGNRKAMKKWLGSDLCYSPQGQGDIGERMARSFADSFKKKLKKWLLLAQIVLI